jgi:hypothetical protein
LVLDPWYPLFALLQSDLQYLGAQAMNAIAHLELRVSRQVGAVLAGHEPSEAKGLGIEARLEATIKGLRLGLVFGGKRFVVHDVSPGESEFQGAPSGPAILANSPPTFETPTFGPNGRKN